MTITLPYPPSTNNLYFTAGHGKRVLKTQGKAYKQQAAALALAAGMRPIETGEIVVMIDLYRPARRGDLDNSFKICLDSLKGIAWRDDSQVCEIRAKRHDTDRTNPRAIVTVTPLADAGEREGTDAR